MGRATTHPIYFANKAMNELINARGDFSMRREGLSPIIERIHLQQHPKVTLLQRLIDLDNDVVSLFRHEPSQALMMLREVSCRGRYDCQLSHGVLIIAASSHDNLASAVLACNRGAESVDEVLHGGRDHDVEW